jgi:hypothetical protein
MAFVKMRGVVIEKLPFPPTRGILAERSYDQRGLETKALEFRRALRYVVMDRIKGIELYDKIQEYRVTVEGKSYRVVCCFDAMADDREAEARFNPKSQKYEIVLTPETYACLEKGIPRGTSTFLHECCHIFLHAALLKKMGERSIDSRALFQGGKPHNHYVDTEWQAEALTSAIAMPAHGIRKLERELQEQGNTLLPMPLVIQKHFGVSPEAAANRWDLFNQKRGTLMRDKLLPGEL